MFGLTLNAWGQTVMPEKADAARNLPASAQSTTTGDPDPVDAPADAKHRKAIEDDVRAGKEYTTKIEKTLKFSKDTDAQNRLTRVGRVIAKIARHNRVTVLYGDPRLSPFDYTFKLVQGDDVNAFSVPGGSIYVYEGLMKFIESDDELAAVLAHEVSHAAFRHYATMSRQSSLIDALAIPALLAMILSRSDAAVGLAMATQMASASFQSGWSVQAEQAADFGSVQFLAKSPYQPVAMLTFMERLAEKDTFSGQHGWSIYTTHPPSELRARTVYQELTAMNVPIRRSLVTKSLCARMETRADMSAQIFFGPTLIYTFRGDAGTTRAAMAVSRLNDFFDRVPELYQLQLGEQGALLGAGRELFRVTGSDPTVSKREQDAAFRALRKGVFDVGMRASLVRNGNG